MNEYFVKVRVDEIFGIEIKLCLSFIAMLFNIVLF